MNPKVKLHRLMSPVTARRLALVCLAACSLAMSHAADRYFDAGVSAPLTWDQGTTANWSISAAGGPYDTHWGSDDFGFFKGIGGEIAVSGNVNSHGLTFQTDGYVLSGGAITLGSPTGGPAITVEDGVTASISSTLHRAGEGAALRKLKSGTLRFSGNINFNPGDALAVDAGTLEVNGAGQLDSGSHSGLVSIANGATLRINSSADNAFTHAYGVTAFSGNLSKDNSGSLSLKRLILSSTTGGQSFTMSAGTLTCTDWFISGMGSGTAGTGANATITQTGGDITVPYLLNSSQFQLANNGGTTTADFSGGTLTLDTHFTPHLSQRGTGNVTISGTSVVTSKNSGGIRMGGQTGSTANLHLNRGGTLVTTRISKGNGTANVIFDGGTLKAYAGSSLFLQGLSSATIRAGGAIIDSNHFDITIAQALLEDGGSRGGGLVKSGTGVLSLSGTNTFTGSTVVQQGTLRLVPGSLMPANLKIQPLGDSITYGANSGYRSTLYTLLNPVAPGFQFVGDSNISAGTLPSAPIDQRHHAGHSSYTLNDINNNLDGLDTTTFVQFGGAARNPNGGYWYTGGNGTGRTPLFPDAVLLLCGANDVARIGIDGVQGRLESLLGKITTMRPNARVFLAKMTPYVGREAGVTAYNNIVPIVVADFQAAGKKVTLVDLFTGFNTAWLTDGVHPNATGYNWMANKWYEALVATYAAEASSQALAASTSVAVHAGATLEGAGQLGGTLAVAGTVAPGNNGIGTITAGTTTLTGTYACQLDGIAADKLTITGDLNLNGATIHLHALTAATASTYLIATYSGSLIPITSPPVISGLTGYRLDTSTPGQINISLLTGYEAWAVINGNAPNGGPDDDHDDDGVANAIEYVLGGDKDTDDLGKIPKIVKAGTSLTVSFLRDQDTISAGLELVIEVGTTLATWPTVYPVPDTPAANSPAVTVADNGNGTDKITLSLPIASDTLKFARLRVTIAPPASAGTGD
jgi:autotransporter-associated beta strand protein